MFSMVHLMLTVIENEVSSILITRKLSVLGLCID